MFLTQVQSRTSGILLYGITPPKAQTPADKLKEIAAKGLATLRTLEIDGLVVYDVQDETERTSEERPFPFSNSVDPLAYANEYLSELNVPKIIYRPAGKFTPEELAEWLKDLRSHGHCPFFVGLPSPDYVPKTSLPDAYRIWHDVFPTGSVIGAVAIPERHAILKDEHTRMLDKMNAGVSYFITQCVFDVDGARKMLEDLSFACKTKGCLPPTVIFTLTICGSMKTMQFLDWLGIHMPAAVKDELSSSANPASCSVELGLRIARDLVNSCKHLGIPVGFNIESVAIRKQEFEASIELLNSVRELLKVNGMRSVGEKVSVIR